ncbi:MAG: hypothetical protein ACHQ50_02330 [Fimbriimonadales bacterium]
MSTTKYLFAAVATGALAAVLLAGQAKPETVTVKGEVVDLWCFLDDGSHGPDHKACGIACVKAGNPIGIVDDKGNIYVALGKKDRLPGRDLLIDKMSETVTVEGTLVKKGGTQALYISSVSATPGTAR